MNRHHSSPFWHALDFVDLFDTPVWFLVAALIAVCVSLVIRTGREACVTCEVKS